MRCESCGNDAKSVTIFCDCGKLRDRNALRSIGFKGFTGRASLKPGIERMYETGDPPG